MYKWEIVPLKSVGKVSFGDDRVAVRNLLGDDYREIKKSIFSENTMDAYPTFHMYFTKDNQLEAIEFFSENKLLLAGKKLFPGKIKQALKLVSDLQADGNYYTSTSMSIGITVSADDPNTIESVLVGCAGYYEAD